MKKLFTFAAAILASVAMMAADPDLAINTESQGTSNFVTAYAEQGITLSSTASFSSGAVQLGNTPSSYDQHYFEVLAASNTIDSISFLISGNGSNKSIQAPLFAWAETATSNTADTYVLLDPVTVTANSYAAAQWFTYDLSTAEVKCARIYRTTKHVSSTNPAYEGSSTALGSGQTIKIYGIKVWLKEGKTIVSTVETLTAVKVNGTAISASDFADLISSRYVNLDEQYITAPVVTFTKHTVITYDDQTTKESDTDIEVTAELVEVNNVWEASAVIAETEYRVIMPKAASYTVTYKLADETVLGIEVVAAGGHPAEYAQYEVMPLSTFNGWYDEDYLEEVDLSQVVVNSDMYFYADFDKAYAQSIDFEGMVITNGKSYDVKSALDANFYDYKTIDALDSLNNSKGAARNEPYLGLKIKKNGGYLACNVLPGTTLRVKFGYVGDKVLAIAGSDTLPLTPTDNKLADLEVPFAIEKLVKLQTTSDKTVVIKQIMIDEPIVTWMYPITYAAAENGKVEGWTIAFPGEDVTVAIAPEAGYQTYSLTYNGVALHDDENTGAATFTMPAEAVSVVASFVTEYPTAIDNSEVEIKAVKRVVNGQLVIEKNGVLYNAQGKVVK